MSDLDHEWSRTQQHYFTVTPMTDRLAETIVLPSMSAENQAGITDTE